MLLSGLLLVLGTVVQGSRGTYVDIKYTINVRDEDVMTYNRSDPSSDLKPYYKILTRDTNGKMYVGGLEELLVLDAASLQELHRVTVPEDEQPRIGIPCRDLTQASVRDKICQNYIRLAEDLSNNTILVCGTNSYDPMCRFIDITNGNYSLRDGRVDGLEKVQYSVVQNSTALLYNQTAQRLFVGHTEGNQRMPSHISKFEVTDTELRIVSQTDDQKENHINEPDFVGKPFRHGGFIYFFYRETAVEAVNQGKFVYSRVGRVCENDESGTLYSFFKARLNCSLLGDFPFYFDHIQDVIVEKDENGSPIFYAVFTTTPHGPASAAVCSYRMEDIIDIFETSKFKGKTEISRLPGPIERPLFQEKFTQCTPGGFNAEEIEFQKDFTLMDQLVPNYNARVPHASSSHQPLFYSTQMNLFSIAHDQANDIFYVGTEHGTVLKAVWGEEEWDIYEQEMSEIKHPVTGLHYSDDVQSLLVANEQGLYKINLASCEAYCREECDNSYSGYCEATDDTCAPHDSIPGDRRQLRNVDVRILSTPDEIVSCPSRRVELTCEVQGSEACGAVDLVWKFESETPVTETLVTCSGGSKCVGSNSTLAPFIQYQEISSPASYKHYKLVHLTVNIHKGHTAGTFTCEGVSSGGKRSRAVTIKTSDSEGCLTLDSYKKREHRQNLLKNESVALETCNGESSSSQDILFQTCDQCPGDVKINKPGV